MKAKILEPIPDGNDAFVWAQFEVRKSQFGDFMGVYAKQNIAKFTVIPILGMEEEIPSNKTHIWVRSPTVRVNGHPSLYPHNEIGNFGLSIVMLINEPSQGSPNCVFRGNSCLIQRPLQAGEELTIYYGDGEDYVRLPQAYKDAIENNGKVSWIAPDLYKAEFSTAKIYKKYNLWLNDRIDTEQIADSAVRILMERQRNDKAVVAMVMSVLDRMNGK
jgi:hypothetical protein